MDATQSGSVAQSERAGPKAPFDSLKGLVRLVALSGIAGLIAGVTVGGLGGRLFMRIAGAAAPDLAQGVSTEAGFTVGEVTAEGTIGLVVFIGLFVGIFGAVTYVVLSPWLMWAGPWRGVAFGVVLFALSSATSDVMNPDNFDFLILKNGTLLVALIAGLFVLFGAVIDWLFRLLDARSPDGQDGWDAVGAVYVVIASLGVLTLFLVQFILFSSESCDCQPPLVASWSLIVAAVGTALWWASILLSGAPPLMRRVSSFLGYGGLAGVVVFGLIRALSDAAEIIT